MRWLVLPMACALGSGLAFAPACSDDSAAGGGGTTSSAGGAGGGTACSTVVTPPPAGAPWETLAEWNLFCDIEQQTPSARVVAFDVNSPLFSDYAAKWRFLYVPEAQTIGYDDLGRWQFPQGSILVKTFAYLDDPAAPSGARRLIETRILYLEADGWSAHTYIYAPPDAGPQANAEREVAGKFISLSFKKPDGSTLATNYHVPNTNECKDCHTVDDQVIALGPRTRQLDKDHDYGAGMVNQIDHMVGLGLFDKAPLPAGQRIKLVDPFVDTNASLSDRVRSYFDANCAHCHTVGGSASQSALLLNLEATELTEAPANWGVCKVPTSASDSCGNLFDVVPGAPEQSILVCRLSSTELDTRMPPLGSAVIHDEGVALVSEWIAAMPAETCQ